MNPFQKSGYFLRTTVLVLLCSVFSSGVAVTAHAFTAPNQITACYDCHGSPIIPGGTDIRPVDSGYRNISTGGFVGNHQRHILAATTNTLVCTPCHGPAPTAMNHRNGVVDMRMHINSTATTVRGYYNKPAGSPAAFFNQTSLATTSTCNNVNCHFRTITPTWGSAALSAASDLTCGACHTSSGGSGSVLISTGSHTRHINKIGNAIATCSTCHPSNASFTHATSAKTGRSITVTVSGGSYTAGTHAAYPNYFGTTGYGSCNTIYCHSSAQSATGGALTAPDYKAVTWGQGALTCASCHGNTTATLTSGSHSKHLGSTYVFACSDCHGTGYSSTTVNDPTHADQTINISLTTKSPSGTYSGDGTPANSNFGVCNNTICHGKNSATWGTSASNQTCTECHGQPNVAYANISSAIIAPGGSGVDTGGNSVATAPRVGAHQAHLLGSSNISDKMHCGECHVRPAAIQDATHLNFTTATVSFANAVLAKADTHTPGASKVSGIINCSNTYCHTANRPVGTGAGQSGVNTPPVWNNSTLIGGTTIADTCTAKCHNLPPGGTVSGDTHYGLATIATFSGLSACSGCHSATLNASPTTFATIFKDKTMHINGVADAPGANCLGCHGVSKTKTKPSAGTIRQVVGVGGDFVRLSRHVSNGSATENVTKWDCIVCHREGDMNSATGATDTTLHGNDSGTGLVQLRNVDTPTTGWAINNKAMTEVMRTDLDTFCLTCHDSNGAAGINVNGTDSGLNLNATRALTPWNTTDNLRNGRDGLTTRTRVIDVKTQFNAGSGGAGAGYNGNPSQHAVLGARYSTNDANWTSAAWTSHTLRNGTVASTVRETGRLHCSDCHLSETNAHGATNAWFMLLNGTANDYTSDAANQGSGAAAPSATITVCYKCHSSTTYSSSGTTPSRFNHSNDSGHTFDTADAPKLGTQCLNCHAGDSFGGIHGVSGTYAPGSAFPPSGTTYTRYRFLPGAWMQYKPGTAGSDTDFSTNTAGTCYFPASSTMSACTSHAGSTKTPSANNYGRAVKY
jgi:predicted CxxxxCH...CXXCH cytochrome family protein